MFGFGQTRERPHIDPIRASIIVASQRNERASENVREVLRDMLERNDIIRGNER